MGSALGAIISYNQYKDQKKSMDMYNALAMKQAAEEKAEEENLKKMTPAEAQNPEIDEAAGELAKKKRGVQSTMLASAGKSEM